MRIALCLSLVVLPGPLLAGIYNPRDTFLFEIEPGNIAKAIQYPGGFDSILADYRDINVPDSRLKRELEERIRELRAGGVSRLSPEELAEYSADLLRVNRGDEALNLLHPLARDPRKGGFLVYAHLARAHAGRGEWREAAEQQLMAVKYNVFPTRFGRLSRDQLGWLKKVETDYYLPWLRRRAEEARGVRVSGLNESPDRLFPASGKAEADFVRFQAEDGSYRAGGIPEAEAAKLPPDAIAILQQLLIWHPNDPRLLWQLGELYNAAGDMETAARIMDLGSYSQGYSNPQLLEHRRILQTAVSEAASERAARQAELQQNAEAEKALALDEEKKLVRWIITIFVAGGVLLLYYAIQAARRQLRKWN